MWFTDKRNSTQTTGTTDQSGPNDRYDPFDQFNGLRQDSWLNAFGWQLPAGTLDPYSFLEAPPSPVPAPGGAAASQSSAGGGSLGPAGLSNTDNGSVLPPAYDDVQTGSAKATAGTATTAPPVTATGTGSGLHINLVWDASVSAAPAGFMAAVQSAASLIDAAISTPITLNIAVGWGEIGGSLITASGVAEGGPTAGIWQSYSTVVSELKAGASSSTDTAAIASLASSQNPNGNGSVAVWSAQEKALGVISGSATGIDGEIGFSTDFPSSYWVGAAVHEITHAMGRTSGYSPYGILDLFRYSGPGQHVYAGGTNAYFSVDGGKTALQYFATSSDYGDWGTSATDPLYNSADPNNAYVSSSANGLTAADLAELDAIGFALAGSSAAPPPALADLEIAAVLGPSNVARGSTMTFTYLLGDIGQASAGASTEAYRIDSKPTSTSYLGRNTNAGLAAGGQTAFTDTISTAGLSVGQHTLWIMADSGNTVSETNETNNWLALTFNVTAAGKTPPAGATYAFAPSWGNDVIAGWQSGSTIDFTALAGVGVHGMANLTQSIVGGNDVIAQGSNSITLSGVHTTLGASSFRFA